jgi:integrase
LRSCEQARLFPDLTRQGSAKRYSQYICKRFNEKLRSFGVEGVSMYGLRHTAITALASTCDNDAMRKRLAGHTLTGEDGRYIKGFDTARLKEAIGGIQYPGIDAAFIMGA